MIQTDFEVGGCFADMPTMLRLWRRASLWRHAIMTPGSQRSQNRLKLTSTLTVTFEPR